MGKSSPERGPDARFTGGFSGPSPAAPIGGYLFVRVYTNTGRDDLEKVAFYGALSLSMVTVYGSEIGCGCNFGNTYNQPLIVPTSRIGFSRRFCLLRAKTYRYKV